MPPKPGETNGGSGKPDPGPGEPPDENGGGLIGVVPGGGGGGEPAPAPLAAAALTAGAGGDAAGTRAAGLAGAMLGVLALASGLVWALYKFKPGLIPLGGAGARGAAAAAAPLLEAAPAGAGSAVAAGGAADGAAVPVATAPAASDVGTMTAAGYRSAASAAGDGAYARGFGVLETSQTLTVTESALGGGAVSPTSTMNRGIQTDVADGGVGLGVGGAGGVESSTFIQSTMSKNVYSSQQADSTFADGSVTSFTVAILELSPTSICCGFAVPVLVQHTQTPGRLTALFPELPG